MSDHARPFDAVKEADKMEHLAKERLDTHNTFTNDATATGLIAAHKLVDEWASLTDEERIATSMAAIKKYGNHKLDAQPIPSLVTNINGETIGLEFEAATADFNLGPASIKVLAAGNLVVASHSRFLPGWRFLDWTQTTDCSIVDPQGSNRRSLDERSAMDNVNSNHEH